MRTQYRTSIDPPPARQPFCVSQFPNTADCSTPTMASPSALAEHTGTEDEMKGHYQLGDLVEARFGGKSKWFPGKIRQVHESLGGFLYDIAYDDGDAEESVFAGRVRRPGQSPPSPRAGLTVDVKLARKGKVRKPKRIGRSVNLPHAKCKRFF